MPLPDCVLGFIHTYSVGSLDIVRRRLSKAKIFKEHLYEDKLEFLVVSLLLIIEKSATSIYKMIF